MREKLSLGGVSLVESCMSCLLWPQGLKKVYVASFAQSRLRVEAHCPHMYTHIYMYIRHVETLIAKSMEGIPKIWLRDISGRAGTGTIGQLYMHVAISLLCTSMVSSANKSIQPQDSLIYGEQSLMSTCCSTGKPITINADPAGDLSPLPGIWGERRQNLRNLHLAIGAD